MKRKTLLMVIFAMVCMIIVWVCSSCINRNPYLNAQERLAEQLGVRIEDYTDPLLFPAGYYYTILKPGMNLNEVHNAIQGYEKVFHCGIYSEIYYYFSKDDSKAIRFVIVYDEEGKYRFIEGEEPDSRTIRLDGCVPGLIGKNSEP